MKSVRKYNDLPFCSATYFGNYHLSSFIDCINSGKDPLECTRLFFEALFEKQGAKISLPPLQAPVQGHGCSAFYCRTDDNIPLLAKNLDYKEDPVLLLRTRPADGYESLSVTNVSFCDLFQLNSLKHSIILAPFVPLDGINENGLAVSMLSSYSGAIYSKAPERPTVGDFHIIRIILDRCKNVEEAIECFEEYNLVQTSVLPLHYIIADEDVSCIVEFVNGEMHTHKNDSLNYMTNFHMLNNARLEQDITNCERYRILDDSLSNRTSGTDIEKVRQLLDEVSVFSHGFQVPSTLWSIVYDIVKREMHIKTGKTKKYYRVAIK